MCSHLGWGYAHAAGDCCSLRTPLRQVHAACRLCRLMVENAGTEEFACYPGHTFLNIDCIRTLHQILDIQVGRHDCRCRCVLVWASVSLLQLGQNEFDMGDQSSG